MQMESAVDTLAHWGVRQLLSELGGAPIGVALWDGRRFGPDAPVGSLQVHDRLALLRILADPEVAVGDLYAEGRVHFEGDLVGLLRASFRARPDAGLVKRILPRRLVEGVLRQDLWSARRNAQHHYDVGNEFYSLWLDERMVYTCAYFPTPATSLEEAQLAKMDHVCRKVRLRPGQRVLEAGCGWGALALHMARYYGVTVRAFNVSHEQVLYAREQAEKQGLQDRVEFIEDDYRNATGRCNAFVSVGMLEHVGPDHYDELGEVIDRTLEPEGLGLLHTIGRSQQMRLNRWIRTRVFPNAHPPTLREMMQILEPRDFVTLDAENLRLHYALTARHWLERYERSMDRLVELVGPEKARTWHLYLAGTVAAFEASTLQLFQVTFTRARNDHIPWTRAHLYPGEEPQPGSADQ